MSKQSEAKQAQNYMPKASPNYCSNCQFYRSDKEVKMNNWSKTEWIDEKNMRCGIGGFAIKKQGVCDVHMRDSSTFEDLR